MSLNNKLKEEINRIFEEEIEKEFKRPSVKIDELSEREKSYQLEKRPYMDIPMLEKRLNVLEKALKILHKVLKREVPPKSKHMTMAASMIMLCAPRSIKI